MQKKIWTGDKTLISNAELKGITSGAVYRLPNYNQRIQINTVGQFTTENIKNNSKNRTDLGITTITRKPITDLAVLLGFESVAAMGKSKNYSKFAKSKNYKLDFYRITLMSDVSVESETEMSRSEEISPKMEDETLNPTKITAEMSKKIEDKINNQKDEC